MEPLASDNYERFTKKPVVYEPWDPRSRRVARQVMGDLSLALEGLAVEILHMGSTALEIAGKNDIEVYVYPVASTWHEVLKILRDKYGKPGYQDEDFIRFDAQSEGFELEILQLRGYIGKVNKALHKYLAEHPALCDEYAAIKRQYSYSKREYQRHKERFFDRVVSQIREDYISS